MGTGGAAPTPGTTGVDVGACSRSGAPGGLLRTDATGYLTSAGAPEPVVHATGGDTGTVLLEASGRVLTDTGDGSLREVAAPDGADGALTDAVQVAADSSTAAARTADGRVIVWGDSSAGQTGEVHPHPLPWPTTVAGADDTPLTGLSDLAVDGRTLAAVTAAGTVLVWGDGRHGQLGPGVAARAGSPPVAVAGEDGAPLDAVADVAVGGQHVVVSTDDGRVLTWGSDSHGQLGTGGTGDRATPAEVDIPARVVAVAASELNSYAVTSEGRVFAWGNDESGQTGSGGAVGTVMSPREVQGAEGVACVAAGEAFAAALTTRGEVLTWGAGGNGQLAAGETRQRRSAAPALREGGEGVTGARWVGAAHRTLLVGVEE